MLGIRHKVKSLRYCQVICSQCGHDRYVTRNHDSRYSYQLNYMNKLITIIKETCDQSIEMGMTTTDTIEFLIKDESFYEILYNAIEDYMSSHTTIRRYNPQYITNSRL